MPRRIDRAQRRRDILDATFRILGEEGLSGLSFRAIAERLGGSTTMVTHYFSSQAELLDAVMASILASWDAELAELEVGASSAAERLWLVLNWLVPKTSKGIDEERTRIVLLREQLMEPATERLFASWDTRIRNLIGERLQGLVPDEQVALRVDLLRSVTNGLTLSILERPDAWPTDRIDAVLRCAMEDIGLTAPFSDDLPREPVTHD